jgi:hypothetical protein
MIDGTMSARRSSRGERLNDRRTGGAPRPASRGPAADGVEHPLADRVDDAGVLGGRDERARPDEALLGIVPADERLGGVDALADRVEDGLEVQDELVALERTAQAGAERQACAGVDRVGLVERGPAAAAARLLHRHLGAAQEVVGVVGVLGVDAHADACAEVELGAGDAVRPRERLADQPSDDGGGVERTVLEVAQHEDEPVAARAGDDVVGARDVAQALRGDPQGLVAGRVTERVVDQAEAVEVEVENGDRRLVATSARDREREVLLEQLAVRQAGQGVVVLEELGPLLGQVVARDVVAGADHAVDAPVVGEQQGAAPGDDALLARGGDHARLEARLGVVLAAHEPLEGVAGLAALAWRDGDVEPVRAEQLGLAAAEHRARGRVDRAHTSVRTDDHDHRSVRQQVDDGAFQPVHAPEVGTPVPHLKRADAREDGKTSCVNRPFWPV